MSEPRTCSADGCTRTGLTTDDFYTRKDYRGISYDCYCKVCRKKKSTEYQKQYGHGISKKRSMPKRVADLNRQNEEYFTWYMESNPGYFRYVFHMENTGANIRAAFVSVA